MAIPLSREYGSHRLGIIKTIGSTQVAVVWDLLFLCVVLSLSRFLWIIDNKLWWMDGKTVMIHLLLLLVLSIFAPTYDSDCGL